MSLSREMLTTAASFDSATLHEAAGKIGALPWLIKPVSPNFRVCGTAFPVRSPGGDNLWIHRAIDQASTGDVLVVDVEGVHGHGYWGEIMSTAAKAKGLAGLVIDGCVRDSVLLAEIGFPVFSRGLCIQGTGKNFAAHGTLGEPIKIGEVVVRRGDLVFGDRDGVVSISRDRVGEVLSAASVRAQTEKQILERLQRGESTLDIYGWRDSR